LIFSVQVNLMLVPRSVSIDSSRDSYTCGKAALQSTYISSLSDSIATGPTTAPADIKRNLNV
jgi:hypothetical protein